MVHSFRWAGGEGKDVIDQIQAEHCFSGRVRLVSGQPFLALKDSNLVKEIRDAPKKGSLQSTRTLLSPVFMKIVPLYLKL